MHLLLLGVFGHSSTLGFVL
uniref:Uncharacterized protein n=1 Tax=Lepeophtheirus salmonis TaxID=72036 RepID=A0A0K2TJA3_LEPSM